MATTLFDEMFRSLHPTRATSHCFASKSFVSGFRAFAEYCEARHEQTKSSEKRNRQLAGEVVEALREYFEESGPNSKYFNRGSGWLSPHRDEPTEQYLFRIFSASCDLAQAGLQPWTLRDLQRFCERLCTLGQTRVSEVRLPETLDKMMSAKAPAPRARRF